MTFICTSRVRHGDFDATVTGRGDSRGGAFVAAVMETNAGYRPIPDNVESALKLLERHDKGAARGESYLKEGGAYLNLDDDDYPVVSIGWVTFTWTQTPRLWAITAQVSVSMWAGRSSRQVPTFYLDPAVQGITDQAHAERIADDILSTAGPVADKEIWLHVHAEPIY